MKKAMMAVLSVGLILTVAGIAGADTISFDATFASTPVPGSGSVSLPKYDPSLGELLSVMLTLDATANAGVISFDNESDAPPGAEVELSIGATVQANAPASIMLLAIPATVGNALVAVDNDVDPDFIGTDAFSVTGLAATASDDDSLFGSPAVDPYIASFLDEMFQVTLATTNLATTQVRNGHGPSVSTAGEAGGTVTVTYEYIPEPATLALLGVGALVLLRRRNG